MNSLTSVLLVALVLIIAASSSSVQAGGLNQLIQCSNGCSKTASPAGCKAYNFSNNQCFDLRDATSVRVGCAMMTTCARGEAYTSTDCSGASVPFASTCDGISSCNTVGPNSDSFTYFQCQTGGIQAALACGIQCADCVAVTPTRKWGECIEFPTGSIKFNGSYPCRFAGITVYAEECSDVVPESLLPIGTNGCRTTSEVTGSPQSFEIQCNDPLPTTTAAPTPAPPTTPIPTRPPMIQHVACTDSGCKESCRPAQFPSGQCMKNYASGGSFIGFCTATNIVTKNYNTSTTCAGTPSNTQYSVPKKCYPDPSGKGSFYDSCA